MNNLACFIPGSSEYVDERGNPVKRTKRTHPYSYDGFVTWQIDGEPNHSVYSDQLLMWDYNKHNKLCKKYFGNEGQCWRERSPKKIEAFLRDWFEVPSLKLIRVMEHCNVSSGFPLWSFGFCAKLNEEKKK